MFNSDNQSLAAPKLNVMTINQALGLGYGFVVAVANQRLESNEMPVDPDRESPILCQPEVPLRWNHNGAGKQVLYCTRLKITIGQVGPHRPAAHRFTGTKKAPLAEPSGGSYARQTPRPNRVPDIAAPHALPLPFHWRPNRTGPKACEGVDSEGAELSHARANPDLPYPLEAPSNYCAHLTLGL
jgi:hypothetical protein